MQRQSAGFDTYLGVSVTTIYNIVMDQNADSQWEQLARNLLRGELMKRGMSYAALRDALADIGIEDTEGAIKSKMSRGRFSAVFFLQCMTVIGADWIQIPGLPDGAGAIGLGQHGAQALAKKQKPKSEK